MQMKYQWTNKRNTVGNGNGIMSHWGNTVGNRNGIMSHWGIGGCVECLHPSLHDLECNRNTIDRFQGNANEQNKEIQSEKEMGLCPIEEIQWEIEMGLCPIEGLAVV